MSVVKPDKPEMVKGGAAVAQEAWAGATRDCDLSIRSHGMRQKIPTGNGLSVGDYRATDRVAFFASRACEGSYLTKPRGK
jgi:hypothetical protein